MNNRVLVAYATKHGSTEQMAQWIANGIQASHVDVLDVQNVQDVTNYDFVVLGTPMYNNEPLEDMKSFITNHKEELEHVDKAVYIAVTEDDSEHSRDIYTNRMKNYVPGPIKFTEVFSGEINLGELSDVEKQEARGYFNKIDEPMQSYNFMYQNDFTAFSDRVNQCIRPQ